LTSGAPRNLDSTGNAHQIDPTANEQCIYEAKKGSFLLWIFLRGGVRGRN